MDRQAACAACREHLCDLPEQQDLFPRDTRSRRDDTAYLEKDRHAEVVVQFFCDYFRANGQLIEELPSAGIRLEVRTRFDAVEAVQVAAAHDSDTLICASGAAAGGECLQFALFCHAGARGESAVGGHHFDPLLPVAGNEPVQIFDEDS